MKSLNCLVTGASSGIGKEISIELSTHAKHIYICSRNVQKLEIVHDKIIKNKGRILVRKSGTEPKIRIMCESEDSNLNKLCVNIIKKSIQ